MIKTVPAPSDQQPGSKMVHNNQTSSNTATVKSNNTSRWLCENIS